MLHRLAVLLAGKLHITQKIPAALLTAVFYILLAVMILFAGVQLVSALKVLLPQLPDLYTNQFLPFWEGCISCLMETTIIGTE